MSGNQSFIYVSIDPTKGQLRTLYISESTGSTESAPFFMKITRKMSGIEGIY